MGQPAASLGDMIVGLSTLIVLVPPDEVPTPFEFTFSGELSLELSENVFIEGRPAALFGSQAINEPSYELQPRPGEFLVPPSELGTVDSGSATVLINKKPAVRAGDIALIAEVEGEAPAGTVVLAGISTVMVGG